MERVLIIGPCGSGKSTLARELAPRLGLPLVHMDQLYWKPGWVETSDEVMQAKIEALSQEPRWIIDGNYGGTLRPRLERADAVIYLDYPIRLCLWRLIKRIWTTRGQVRADMAEGCPEQFDFSFLIYVARWNSGPKLRLESNIAGYSDKIIRMKSPRALLEWQRKVAGKSDSKPCAAS
jgi:adenylate kinase family enzyme